MNVINEYAASIKALQECFFPSADLVYRFGNQENLERFGVYCASAEAMPDAVLLDPAHNRLVVVDFAMHRGQIDEARLDGLHGVFSSAGPEQVYITVYPNRVSMSKFPELPAWDSHAWFVSEPDHMIHFNGSRFLGPYES